jgi:hypothetical protein
MVSVSLSAQHTPINDDRQAIEPIPSASSFSM